MISKGSDQSGDFMIGAVVRVILSVSKAFKHASSKIKVASLASKLHKGHDILLKSLMNLR